MRKAIITIGASAIAALASVGAVASNNISEVQKPMTGEETEIIEYVEIPEKADIAVDGLSEHTEAQAEIVEKTEPSECEKITKEVLDTYGTLDFFYILGRAWNGKAGEHFEQLGVKTWEEFKERYNEDIRVKNAAPKQLAEYLLRLEERINDACK